MDSDLKPKSRIALGTILLPCLSIGSYGKIFASMLLKQEAIKSGRNLAQAKWIEHI